MRRPPLTRPAQRARVSKAQPVTGQRTGVRTCGGGEMADQGERPPVLFRGGTVLTMDDAKTVLTDADVLTQDYRIAAVGQRLDAPPGCIEVDASGGIVMPGMIDTHRHMWQSAM